MTELKDKLGFNGLVTDTSNPFFDLARHYNSVSEIINDPDLEALARFADMRRDDLANILIKSLAIQKGLLEQPIAANIVTVNINGENVVLLHPEDGKPLTYGDILADRSGPMFAGFLNARAGAEMLEVDPEHMRKRETLIPAHEKAIIQACDDDGVKLPAPERIAQAMNIFSRLHESQRKLSDFDITMADSDTLYTAFGNAVKTAVKNAAETEYTGDLAEERQRKLKSFLEEMEIGMADHLSRDVAKTHWQQGGVVDTGTIITAYLSSENYADVARQNGKIVDADHEQFTHMLLEGPGKAIKELGFSDREYKAKADATYGLGVTFSGPEVEIAGPYSKEAPLEKTTDKAGEKKPQRELGDVICDATSDNEYGISAANVMRAAREEIAKTHKAAFDALLQETSETTYRRRFEQAFVKLAETEPQFAGLAEKYKQDMTLAISLRIAEEAGKKLAQCEQFRRQADGIDEPGKEEFGKKKFLGNVSDTEPYLYGALAKIRQNGDNREYHEVLQQQTTLSLLINSARWGVGAGEAARTDLQDIGQLPNVLQEPKEFGKQLKESINGRSYRHPETTASIREELGWCNISDPVAEQRCDKFTKATAPIYDTAKKQEGYYALTGELRKEIIHYQEYSAAAAAGDMGAHQLMNETSESIALIRHDIKTHLKDMLEHDLPALHAKVAGVSADRGEAYLEHLTNQVHDAVRFCVRREELERERAAEKAREETLAHGAPPPPRDSYDRPLQHAPPDMRTHGAQNIVPSALLDDQAIVNAAVQAVMVLRQAGVEITDGMLGEKHRAAIANLKEKEERRDRDEDVIGR